MATLADAVIGAEMMEVEGDDARIDILSNVCYAQIRSMRAVRQLRMTLFVPRTTHAKPAIVYFPGGGFTSSDFEKFAEMRFALARAGFVVAAAEYRVLPARFPAPVEDAKSAVRWLRAHAEEYGVDPERIGILGDSAGGYVVQFLGTTNTETQWDNGDFKEVSSAVQAVASIYGISDLMTIGEGFDEATQAIHRSAAVPEALLINGFAFKSLPLPLTDTPEAVKNASAIYHVKGDEPPFLLMHGTEDPLVSPLQSRHMFDALKAKGVDVEFVMVKGAHHADRIWHQKPIINRVVDWFCRKLGNPAQGEYEKL